MAILSSSELIEAIKRTQSPEELHWLMVQQGLESPRTPDELQSLDEELWNS